MQLRKRAGRKHAGRSLWTFPVRINLDGSRYYACQYVVMDEDGGERTITRGLGIRGTSKYRASLRYHELAAGRELKRRLLAAVDAL